MREKIKRESVGKGGVEIGRWRNVKKKIWECMLFERIRKTKKEILAK